MRAVPHQPTTEELPLYIRWNPERHPHALELKLDLINQINSELSQATRAGIEVGGLLLGSLPSPESPTLRIDQVIPISRRLEDGAVFMLDPRHLNRIAELAHTGSNQVAVGFFRSHLRPGAMRPALADRTLLSQQFPFGDYVLLLIDSREPHQAAFFLAVNGQLPEEPSVAPFVFDEANFNILPEVPAESTLDLRRHSLFRRLAPRSFDWSGPVALMILGAFLVLALFSTGIARWFRPRTNQIDLSISTGSSSGDLLRIAWDHSASVLSKANGAVMVITDGSSRREIRMGPDDLKLGEVDYERLSKAVSVSMTLNPASLELPPQTSEWSSQ